MSVGTPEVGTDRAVLSGDASPGPVAGGDGTSSRERVESSRRDILEAVGSSGRDIRARRRATSATSSSRPERGPPRARPDPRNRPRRGAAHPGRGSPCSRERRLVRSVPRAHAPPCPSSNAGSSASSSCRRRSTPPCPRCDDALDLARHRLRARAGVVRQIRGLCDARLAHDAAFFFDFAPHRSRAAARSRRSARTVKPRGCFPSRPETWTSPSSLQTAGRVAPRLARHARIRTDRAHVLIAGALLGKTSRMGARPAPTRSPRSRPSRSRAAFRSSASTPRRPAAAPPARPTPAPPPPAPLPPRGRRAGGTRAGSPRAAAGSAPRVTAVLLSWNRPAGYARPSGPCATASPCRGARSSSTTAPAPRPARARRGRRRPARRPSTSSSTTWAPRAGRNRAAESRRNGIRPVPGRRRRGVPRDARAPRGGAGRRALGTRGRRARRPPRRDDPDVRRRLPGGRRREVRSARRGRAVRGARGRAGVPLPLGRGRRRPLPEDGPRRFPIDPRMAAYYEDNDWGFRVESEAPGSQRRVPRALVLHHHVAKDRLGLGAPRTSRTRSASASPSRASTSVTAS